MDKWLLRLVLLSVLVMWGITAVVIDLPAPNTSQGALVLPYTILYILLFIPKVLIAGVVGLL